MLSDLGSTVPPGEHVTLIGPSGSGETTILRLLTCLESVSAGPISVGGSPLSHRERAAGSREVRTRIGMVFQHGVLKPPSDFSHCVVMVDGGRIVEGAPPDEFLTSPNEPRTQAFLRAVSSR